MKQQSTELTVLVEELMQLRQRWTAETTVLVRRGLLDEQNVSRLRSGAGRTDVALDVQGLVDLFREHWSTLEGRSFIGQAELDRAGTLASRLVTLLAAKETRGIAPLLRLSASWPSAQAAVA